MASQTSKIHLRSITIIGVGAAVLAVIGYLLLKSDSRKKSKKKIHKSEQIFKKNESTVNEESGGISMSFKEVNETDEINKLCDLYSKKSFNLSPSPSSETIITKPYINTNNKAILVNDEAIVPINNEKVSLLPPVINQHSNNSNIKNEQIISQVENCVECINNNENTKKQNLIINLDEYNKNSDLERNILMNSINQVAEVTDSVHVEEEEASHVVKELELGSETSSDSGNGTSEINIIAHSPHEAEVEDDVEVNETNCLKAMRDNISPDSNVSICSSNENGNGNENNDGKSQINDSIISIATTTSENELKTTIPQSSSSISISSATHPETDIIVYEFHFPRKYCGKLIGRNGVHVDYIRNKTHVQIAVRNDPSVDDLQIVCLTGCISDVDQSLDIISARFPFRHYPQISFKPITKPIVYRRNRIENNKIIVSPNMYVQLTSIKSFQSDVNVSAIVSPTHLFIQLPSQPTYQLLQRLDEDMLHLYSTSDKTIPNLTCPIDYGTICAAPTSYGWHRAMVTDYFVQKESQQNYPYYNGEIEMATVKFLDYGGYLNIPVNQLKQLRLVLILI